MMVLKWICFLIVCLDALAYIIDKSSNIKNIGTIIGLMLGIAARVFVLYNTLIYWVLV